MAPAEVSPQGEFTAAADVHSLTGSSGYTLLVPSGWQQSTTPSGSDKFDDLDPRLWDFYGMTLELASWHRTRSGL